MSEQSPKMLMKTDNDIEFDTLVQYKHDEADAVLSIAEYLRDGEIVRRDVHAKLKPKVLAPVANF